MILLPKLFLRQKRLIKVPVTLLLAGDLGMDYHCQTMVSGNNIFLLLSLELSMLKVAIFPLKVPFISTLQSCPFLEVLTAQGYPISLLLER